MAERVRTLVLFAVIQLPLPFRQLRPEFDEVPVYGIVVDRLYDLRRI